MKQPSQFALLLQRRFAPFFWTQFFGAFNDNVFKTALLTVLTFDAIHWTTIDSGLLNNLIPGLFILPFVLFSATSGQIADKHDKRLVSLWVKALEIVIMLVAAWGWLNKELWLLVAGIAGMGLHSTLFGPVKYAYLPQHLKREELIGGNGLIEMGTFVGILAGEILGVTLASQKEWGIQAIIAVTVGISILGFILCLSIPKSPAPVPELKMSWNPFSESIRNLKFSKQNRAVYLSLLGNSWFWFYGAIVLAQLPVYSKDVLQGDHTVFVLLLSVFSFGIGVGSLLCEKLSNHKVEIGLVPFGAIGLTAFGIELYFASISFLPIAGKDYLAFVSQWSGIRIIFDFIMIGVFGGFYVVPLFAIIQTRSDPNHLSRTIAGMNILNALFMVGAALLAMIMLKLKLTIPQIFLATALLNAIVTIYIFSLLQEFLMRFLAWMLIHTFYKVRINNAENIPESGAAILVCNHVSYLDALVILAASPRPIRFVMDHKIFEMPFASWLFKTAKAIPISSAKDNQFLLERAYIDIAEALHNDELVCIFPEGQLTKTGEVNNFKGGIIKILERSPVTVIPMALRGLWGSAFSRHPGNPFHRVITQGITNKLELVVGNAIAPDQFELTEAQKTIETLRGEWK